MVSPSDNAVKSQIWGTAALPIGPMWPVQPVGSA